MANPKGNPNITQYSIKKGEIRNPTGVNGQSGLTPIVRRLLEQEAAPGKTHAEAIVEAIIKECKRGNPSLIKELWNRLDGAVKTEMNVTSDDGLGVVILPKKKDTIIVDGKEVRRPHRRTKDIEEIESEDE